MFFLKLLESCEDSQWNCEDLAAAGQCWKQATGVQYHQTYTLWDRCKKSCRRCNGKSLTNENVSAKILSRCHKVNQQPWQI